MSDFSPRYRCLNDGDVDIASEIFVRSKDYSQNLESFDPFRTESSGHTIRINKSMLRLESNGRGRFKPPTTSTSEHGKTYYTISAEIFSGPQIDGAGLRGYVASRKSIWLKQGTTIPFGGRQQQDVEAARKYSSATAPFLNYPSGGLELTGEYTQDAWKFARSTSNTSVTWIPAGLTALEAGRTSDNKLSTAWIRFNNTHIEIPTAKYPALHFYDPLTDELIVFYVYRTEVPDDLL